MLTTVALCGCGKDTVNPFSASTTPNQDDYQLPEEESEQECVILPEGIEVTGDIDKLEVSNCVAITEKRHGWTGTWSKYDDGFVKIYEESGGKKWAAGGQRHKVSGTIKNIYDKDIEPYCVKISYYDCLEGMIEQEDLYNFGSNCFEGGYLASGETAEFELFHERTAGTDIGYDTAVTYSLYLEDKTGQT